MEAGTISNLSALIPVCIFHSNENNEIQQKEEIPPVKVESLCKSCQEFFKKINDESHVLSIEEEEKLATKYIHCITCESVNPSTSLHSGEYLAVGNAMYLYKDNEKCS
jgi:hypothetical protein